MPHKKGRISMGLDSPLMLEALSAIEVWSLSREICRNVVNLDFSSDPADEIIAATSITYNVTLMTRDSRIRASKLSVSPAEALSGAPAGVREQGQEAADREPLFTWSGRT